MEIKAQIEPNKTRWGIFKGKAEEKVGEMKAEWDQKPKEETDRILLTAAVVTVGIGAAFAFGYSVGSKHGYKTGAAAGKLAGYMQGYEMGMVGVIRAGIR